MDLTVREALEDAIKREDVAYDYFTKLQAMVKDPGTKKLLEELAEEELQHKAEMQKLLDTGDVSGVDLSCSCAYRDLGLQDTLANKAIDENVTVQDVLAIAIKAEDSARLFYEGLAEQFKGQEVEKLFVKLACDEMCHRNEFQKMYDEIVYSEN